MPRLRRVRLCGRPADPLIVPPDQQAWDSEKVVYLPDCYQPNDTKRPIAQAIPSRLTGIGTQGVARKAGLARQQRVADLGIVGANQQHQRFDDLSPRRRFGKDRCAQRPLPVSGGSKARFKKRTPWLRS